jgi:glutathione-specific gamma-glutamylcyclotransferase
MKSEPPSPISRESLADGTLLRRFTELSLANTLLADDERLARLERLLASVPPNHDLWVFAYGSMLWNPTVHYVEARTVTVADWHRTFCLRSAVGRGTPEQPGLMLGIEPGGRCQGLAYRLPASAIRDEMHLLWQREMLTGAYEAKWVNGFCANHIEIPLVAFVIDPTTQAYEGCLSEDAQIQRIRRAEGILGSNRDYLFKTRSHLRSLGICDEYIERLADQLL